MKFKIIKKTNQRKPTSTCIHFGKSGAMTIYEKAADQMELKAGDQIALIQDNDRPDDFYILKMKSDELPVLRRKNEKSNMLTAGYKDAHRALVDHFQLPEASVKLIVGGAIKTPHGTAWALITNALKKERLKEVQYA